MKVLKKGIYEELIISIEKVETVTPKFNTSKRTSDAGDDGEDPSDH